MAQIPGTDTPGADTPGPDTRGADTPVPDPHATGDGAVMLDIGGDIGAIVVVMPDAYLGREVEIVPAGGRTVAGGATGGFHAGPNHPEGAPPHVGIVPRRMGPRHVATAVFGDLSQGRYVLTLIAPHEHGGHEHEHDDHDHAAHSHETADGTGESLEVDVIGGEVVTVPWPGV